MRSGRSSPTCAPCTKAIQARSTGSPQRPAARGDLRCQSATGRAGQGCSAGGNKGMIIKEGAVLNAHVKLIGLVLVLLVSMLFVFVDSGRGAEWAGVTDDRLLNADRDPSNWLTFYRTYNGWRYSPLSQVNRQTVQKLVPKWIFSLGEVGDQEGTPVVNNGIMVVTAGAPTLQRQR